MSVQWTLVAAFLYTEIAVVLLLLLPFISPKTWSVILRSKILKSISTQSHIYFMVTILILFLFFLDSIREIKKYSLLRDKEIDHAHSTVETQYSVKMFRAQRNFYIAGFALFLWMIIRRLITLICSQATLMADSEAVRKQAESATAQAHKLMDQIEQKATTVSVNEDSGKQVVDMLQSQFQNEICELNAQLANRDNVIRTTELENYAIRNQAESLAKEYDRLLKEYEKLQVRTGVTLRNKDD